MNPLEATSDAEGLRGIYRGLEMAHLASSAMAGMVVELEHELELVNEYATKLTAESSARAAAEATAAAYKQELANAHQAHAKELSDERLERSILESKFSTIQDQLSDAIAQIKVLAAKPPTVIAAPAPSPIPVTPQAVSAAGWDVTVTGRTDVGDIRTLQIKPVKGT